MHRIYIKEQVPHGFLFHFKAFGLLTGQSVQFSALPRLVRELDCMRSLTEGSAPKQRVSSSDLPPEAVDATWQMFNECCEEAMRVNKLGLIVFQFHLGFKPSDTNRRLIQDCRSPPPPHAARSFRSGAARRIF
jgi:hypothetical protein